MSSWYSVKMLWINLNTFSASAWFSQ
jgi:hypothetical protein